VTDDAHGADVAVDGPQDGAAAPPQAEPVAEPALDTEPESGPVAEEVVDATPVAEPDVLAAKAEKADEYLALAQRTQADFENFRRRVARDAAVAQERGIAKLAKELFPAIDNLERAVQAVEAFPVAGLDAGAAEAETQLAAGIKLVQAEIEAALARVGIEPYSPVGEMFDPQHHEAVAQAPIEGAASGTVTEVYQRGYRLGETVLRPARVLVAA
jgi:molecular chaperone GrpE